MYDKEWRKLFLKICEVYSKSLTYTSLVNSSTERNAACFGLKNEYILEENELRKKSKSNTEC